MWAQSLCMLALLACVTAEDTVNQPTSVCRFDIQCPINAYCQKNTFCKCQEGYVMEEIDDEYVCLRTSEYGGTCSHNIQCQVPISTHARCIDGVCKCRPFAHYKDGRCYMTSVIGGYCRVSNNCYLGPEEYGGAYCWKGFCRCFLRHSPKDNGTRCVRDADLGDPCKDDEQCSGEGMECRYFKCSCKENWVYATETNTCVMAAKALWDPCEYDVQCEPIAGIARQRTAVCENGMCACAHFARPTGSPLRCWPRHRPGEECTRDECKRPKQKSTAEECVSEEGEPGYCSSGRCTCKNCFPDPKDFGSASTMSRPPVLAAATFSIAAILRH